MSGAFVYALAAGLCVGVALALWWPLGIAAASVSLLAATAILAIAHRARSARMLIFAIFFVALALGILRSCTFVGGEAKASLARYGDQKVSVVGTVSNDPDVRDASVRANISVVSIDGAPARGTLQAVFAPDTHLEFGEAVEAQGLMQAPQSFVGQNGNTFDYPGYLRVQGVSMLLQDATLLQSRTAQFSILGALYALKHRFNDSLTSNVPQPEASLMEGILLGERRGLSAQLTAMFVAAGLIHIVILSGYSMSVIAESVLRALKFLPKPVAFCLGALALISFVALTGAAATTVRASSMALIALIARYWGRRAAAMRSLTLVAAAMALYNPPMLLLDASFIVSFLATFGLIAFAPAVEARMPMFLARYPEARAILTSTIAVQILALPALLYYTGTVSLLSVPANLLVLPLLGYVMLAGFITGLLGLVHPILALVPALISYVLLRWILLVVQVVAAVPFSATTVNAFPWWGSVLLYVLLVPLAVYIYRKQKVTGASSLRAH